MFVVILITFFFCVHVVRLCLDLWLVHFADIVYYITIHSYYVMAIIVFVMQKYMVFKEKLLEKEMQYLEIVKFIVNLINMVMELIEQ